jgi:hypothetical protein
LARRGLRPTFQRATPRGKPVPAHISRGNATRARVRSLVEHVFATKKRRMSLARATARITLANLACTMRRLVWIEGRGVPA